MAIPANLAQSWLTNAIDHFGTKGAEAAFALYTINHLSSEQDTTVAAVVKQLFCVVGLVPTLRSLVLVAPDAPLFSTQQMEVLFEHVASCSSVVRAIDAAVREADKWIKPFFSKMAAEAPASLSPQADLQHALKTITACFHHMTVAIATARAEQFSRSGSL